RLLLAGFLRLGARHRHHRDPGLARPARQLHEPGDQPVRLAPAADDQQVSAPAGLGLESRRQAQGAAHAEPEPGDPAPHPRPAATAGRVAPFAPSWAEISRADSCRARSSTARRSRVSRLDCPPMQMAATERPAWFSTGTPMATYPGSSSSMAVAYPRRCTWVSSS